MAFKNHSAFDFKFVSLDGTVIPLSQFKGKPVLIVNTASESNFVNQLEGLQEIWEEFGDKGLTVIATPCNDFGEHEPATDNEIYQLCQNEYGITFPITKKVTVNGPNAHPFYRWAQNQVSYFGKPRWDFHKFLIGPDGNIVKWFSTMTTPASKKIKKAIKENLPKHTGK